MQLLVTYKDVMPAKSWRVYVLDKLEIPPIPPFSSRTDHLEHSQVKGEKYESIDLRSIIIRKINGGHMRIKAHNGENESLRFPAEIGT